MKIEFSKEQFESLLRILYLGNWMAHAYAEDEEGNGEFMDLISYICGYAKDMGLSDLVKEGDTSRFFEAFEEVEDLNEIIEEYDDAVFLDKLIYNLAGRDLLNKYGQEKLMAMTDEEYFKLEGSFVQKWQEEFGKNGLQNLVVRTDKPQKRKTGKGKA
jgi:hypothetical protein